MKKYQRKVVISSRPNAHFGKNKSKKSLLEAMISDANIGQALENAHLSQAKCSFLCYSQSKHELHAESMKEKLLFRRGQMPIRRKIGHINHVERPYELEHLQTAL